MKYFTTVKDQEYIIEIDREDEIVVNGQRFKIDFEQLAEGGVLSLLLNNRSLEAIVEERDDAWEVLIHGELYTAMVEDERAHRLARARVRGAPVTGEVTVQSPMPGLIIAIPLAEGAEVNKGDTVVILESMKMENELKAPRDGHLIRVSVGQGDSVEKGQPLVVIGDLPGMSDEPGGAVGDQPE